MRWDKMRSSKNKAGLKPVKWIGFMGFNRKYEQIYTELARNIKNGWQNEKIWENRRNVIEKFVEVWWNMKNTKKY